MHNDSDAILDDLLSRWHHWMKGKPLNGIDRLDDPAFRDAQSRSGLDSADDLLDGHMESVKMQAIDFHVSGDARGQGGLPDPYRTAIYLLARNCYTGRKVWMSKRLPEDPIELGVIISEARNMLTLRLLKAGVM